MRGREGGTAAGVRCARRASGEARRAKSPRPPGTRRYGTWPSLSQLNRRNGILLKIRGSLQQLSVPSG